MSEHLRFRRLWLSVGWALVVLVTYLSLTPAPVALEIEQGDKVSHALAYFALMSWFSNLYESPIERVKLALGFTAMGITLEIVQGLVGYRSFEVMDMGAGTAGVVFGWLLAPPRTPHFLRLAERFWRAHS